MPNGTQIQTQPQYGLPYQRLPGTRTGLTPESMLEQETRAGRQAIQSKYALQWKEVNRSRRFIGRVKVSQMLRQIDMNAKQEMLQLNQQAQQQIAQLRNIDQLAQQGAITNPEEIKARVILDPDIIKAMYPTPEKERTIPQQFGELDVYSHRISQELEDFQIIGETPSKFLSRLKGISPLATAISVLRGPPKGRKGKLQIWDRTIPAKDPKTGEDVMGKWRSAEPGEIARYVALTQEERTITQRKTELLGQPDISRRRVQPGTIGGTFSDKIAESVKPQRTPTTAKPKVIRQRNTRTGQERISYDGGSTWQIISG
ncbi:hypothetical protein KAR91_43865 [Candidatus Pacearchaeota archaeon]|nr:hypothetical protein [Candidatus Pacearchaeota archaeon]